MVLTKSTTQINMENVKKKVLITGADGQLGTELVKIFEKDYKVVPTNRENLDFTNPEQTEAVISREKPELVIHAGAWTNVDGCAEDPEKALLINGFGTKNLAISASEIKALFVYISTNEVFDGERKTPYLETDKTHAVTPYGNSKLAGEKFVQEICRDLGVIVRTSWIYGPAGESNFPLKIIAAAEKVGELKVVDDEVSVPTYAPHLALAVKQLVSKRPQGIFHLINEGSASRYDWAVAILSFSNRASVPVNKIKLADFPRKSKPPLFGLLGNFRAKSLGIVLPPWKVGMAKFFDASPDLLAR